MIPNTLTLGPVTLHMYGLMIGLGVVMAVEAAVRFLRNKGETDLRETDVWNGLWWAMGFGLIGARLYHVVDYWSYYSVHLGEIVAVWNGGMGIYGGLATGLLGLWIYARRRGVSWLSLIDLAAVSLPLGQAVGRFGNFFNQELYGLPTNLPWGIFIDEEHRLAAVSEFSRFHPLFLYEILWNLVGFLVLYFWLGKRWSLGRGKFFAVYLMWYGLGRGLLEGLRINPWTIQLWGFEVATARLVSGLLFLVGCWWLFVVRWRHDGEKEP